MASRLILVAHAATVATHRASFACGEPLDARGTAAAQALAGRWSSPDRYIISPAVAAQQTAAILAEGRDDTSPTIDQALRDLDVGTWAGRSLADIGAAAAAWVSDPGYDRHGGESIAACCKRVGDWLAETTGQQGLTVAITHAAVIRATLLATLDAPLAGFWHIDVAPLTALTLTTDGRRWAVRALTPVKDA